MPVNDRRTAQRNGPKKGKKREKKKGEGKRAPSCLLNILGRLCRGLHEDQPILLGELLPFLRADRPPVGEITLVPDQHDRHVRVRMLPCIFQPARQVVESFPPEESR